MTVPTGGASVSASLGSLTSAVTVTVPAGNYLLTAAGGVSSLPTTLQNGLQDSAQGYPDNAAALQAAVGYGTWSSGWLFNIASGNDTGAFGGVTMTAVSSPTFGNQGPAGATAATIDKAVGFDSAADCFTAGDNFDVTNLQDLCLAWVGKFTTTPGATEILFAKGDSGAARWTIYMVNATMVFEFVSASGTKSASLTAPVGEWYVGMAALDRATGKFRVGVRTLAGVTTVSAETTAFVETHANADNFTVGNRVTAPAVASSFLCSAVYVGAAASCATGLSTNLSTALTNFASAVNATWTVSLDTTSTGRITVSNSFWPCSVSFANTQLRDVLGYAYDFDYPQTAAQMATALGYGNWTSGVGYLLNEAAGNPASVFGTPATLTATSLVYSQLGVRGGADKAITFDATTDNASGGDVLNVTATDDLVFVWVAYHGAPPSGGISPILFSKLNPGVSAAGYQIYLDVASGTYAFYASGSGGALFTLTGASLAVKTAHVGIAVVDRSTGKARIGSVSLRDGTVSVSAEATVAATSTLNTAAFRIGDRADGAGNGPTTTTASVLSAVYAVKGAGVATGLSANLSTALTNFATYMKSQTSTEQAEGLWFPDCPLNLESDPAQCPRVTDLRMTQSPTGQVFGVSGNYFGRHRGVTWSFVPKAQVWESNAQYTNGSYETFAKDVLYGMGHAWFAPACPVSIWWNDAGTVRNVGYTYNSSAGVPGWYVINVASTEPKLATQGGWTGLYRIEFGDIVSVGG
jgi:hypothetical protein